MPGESEARSSTVPGAIRLAATVVVMRDGPHGPEVLLTRRPATMPFGPGLHVFPGGALDPADDDPSLLGRLRGASSLPALHAGPVAIAAIRELFEETGVLLASEPGGSPALVRARPRPGRPRVPGTFAEVVLRQALDLRADWLVPLSRWVTPPVMTRRFDARFFVARLPDGATPVFDRREVAGHAWMTPGAALEAMADGRIELWTPTGTTLQQLARASGLEDVRRHLAPVMTQADPDAPVVDRVAGSVTRIRLSWAGGIAGRTIRAYLVGRRRLAVIDPGDPSDEAAGAIADAASRLGARVAAVLLTSPAPDHAGGAEGLALRLGIPVRAAAGARRVLVSDIEPVAHGELLDVADVPIRVHATPGVNPDHVAYEIRDASTVLVGDLDAGGPVPGIPEPVDEAALATSRQLVDALRPRLRLGAHD